MLNMQQSMRRTWLIAAALVLIVFSAAGVSAASALSVSFSSAEFVIGYQPGDMNFTAYINNAGEFGSSPSFLLEVVSPSGQVRPANVSNYGGNTYSFTGSVAAEAGVHTLRYYANGALITPEAGTPTQIIVKYNIEAHLSVDTPHLDDERLQIIGTVTDVHGNPIKASPRFTVSGATLSSTSYSSGYFTSYIDKVTKAGLNALKFFADGVEIASWTVASNPLSGLSVQPGELYANTDQQMDVIAYIQESAAAGPKLIDNRNLLLELSGVPIIVGSVSGYQEVEYTENSSESYERVVITADALASSRIRFSTSGDLHIYASAQNYKYQGSLTVPVSSTSEFDLVGSPAQQTFVGDNEFTLKLVAPSGKLYTQYWAEVTLGSEKLEFQNSSVALEQLPALTFTPMGTGSVQVKVTTLDRDQDQRVFEKNFPYTLPSIELSQSSIPLGERESLTLTLKDANGNAVDDALVSIERHGSIDGSNGGSGEYIFDTAWNYPGYLRITAVAKDGTMLVNSARLLKIQAPQVLTFQTEGDVLLAGVEHALKVKLVDENDEAVSNAKVTALVDGVREVAFTWSGGVYTGRVSPWTSVELYADTTDGKKAAEVKRLEAQFPRVETNVTAITNGFVERIELAFYHPDTGEALSGELALRSENLSTALRNETSDGKTNKTGSSFAFDLHNRIQNTAKPASFMVDFTYGNRSYNEILKLEAEEPQVLFEPTALQQGNSQKVTLTLRTASGTPLQGILVSTQNQGNGNRTDAEGKVSFTVLPTNQKEYEFTIQRDDLLLQGSMASRFTASLPIAIDKQAPKMLVEGLVDGKIETDQRSYALNVNVTDDFGLSSIFVNNERSTLEGKDADFSKRISLKIGNNTVKLRAMDSSGNSAELEFIIYCAPEQGPVVDPEQPPVDETGTGDASAITLVIGSLVVKQGDVALDAPPVPPTIINGRTMLPFRYLCQTVLNGTVDYEAETRTIYTTVNGHDIVMQVDNPVITVDDEEIELDQAPTLLGNHTLVPVRAFQLVVSDLTWDGATETVTIIP